MKLTILAVLVAALGCGCGDSNPTAKPAPRPPGGLTDEATFDAGPQPEFTALRVFTDQSGWVPHYTGHPIHERFPAA